MPQTAKRITKAAMEEGFVRMDEDLVDTRKALGEFIEGTRRFQESTEKSLRESQEEIARAQRESQEKIEKEQRETQEAIRKLSENLEKTRRSLNEYIGGLGNTIGAVSESALVPNLVKKFKKMGFSFEDSTRRAKLATEKHDIRTEVDALLESETKAMAVEVKTALKRHDVNYHVKRMQKIRRIADLNNDKREFYGAMATAAVDDKTMQYALDQGFYVIEPSGKDVRIVKPKVAKVW